MLIGLLQAVAVKWIGGNYSVLEIVKFRSLVAQSDALNNFVVGRVENSPYNKIMQKVYYIKFDG
jgi:hypothetical protein